MYLQKVKSRKNKNKLFFVGILKVYDDTSRMDPLVRGMDPRIRIRIHIKMSWIRNAACNSEIPCVGVEVR